MKHLFLIFIFLIFTEIRGQVELLEKNEIVLIGSMSKKEIDGKSYNAQLKSEYKEGKTFYQLKLGDTHGQCKANFYATAEELQIIYRIVLNDFSNPGDARTRFKIGGTELTIKDGTKVAAIKTSLYQTKNVTSTLFIKLGDCSIPFTETDWKKLFGK